MKSLLAIASLVALTTTASAESGPHPAPVSENVALGLSVSGTVASYAMLIVGDNLDRDGLSAAGAVGAVLAPSAGHWYARKPVSRGLVIRVAGAGAIALGVAAGRSDDLVGLLLGGLVGGGLVVGGTIDDITSARSAARKYNAHVTATLVPTTNAHGGGLALVGTF